MFSSREKVEGRLQAHSCRSRSLTPDRAALHAAATGDVGELVSIKLDHIGILRGTLERRTDQGFIVALTVDDVERASLASRLDWLRRFQRREAPEMRKHKRLLPRDPQSRLMLSQDSQLDCYVLDISASGASIQASEIPAIGRHVGVGTLMATVVRHLDEGFAVRFVTPQDDVRTVEALINIKKAGRDALEKTLDEAAAVAFGQAPVAPNHVNEIG